MTKQPADPEKDAAWFAIEHGWDIEPREFFEREAPTNGFRYPLAQAIHHLWKRCVKENAEFLRTAPTWQPVGTAPTDGSRVMIFVYGGVRIGSRGSAGWRDDHYLPIETPTHWMPLPAAPLEET